MSDILCLSQCQVKFPSHAILEQASNPHAHSDTRDLLRFGGHLVAIPVPHAAHMLSSPLASSFQDEPCRACVPRRPLCSERRRAGRRRIALTRSGTVVTGVRYYAATDEGDDV